jgi:hypothetical protein
MKQTFIHLAQLRATVFAQKTAHECMFQVFIVGVTHMTVVSILLHYVVKFHRNV